MDSQLLGRALGTAGPEALQRAELSRRLDAIQAAPDIRFDGREEHGAVTQGQHNGLASELSAHYAGVNYIAIDRFEGR